MLLIEDLNIEITFGMDVHMRGGDSFEEKKILWEWRRHWE